METTAPTMTLDAPPAPPAPRPLWQAPVFVLGIVALLGAWFGRPLWPDGLGSKLSRDLASARAQLARPDGDADLALKLATRALETAETEGGPVAEAAFLLGSAYVRLAEAAGPVGATPHWRRARQYLELAEQSGVGEEDRIALGYRLGKVGLALGTDLPAAIRRLEEAVPQMTSRAEGYTLLIAAYQRLPSPDWNKALEANRALRDLVDISETDLAAAKLQGGELLMRLNRPTEARKSLEKILDPAPPAIVVQARLLEARCFQQEKQWGDAARLYQQALADQRATPPEPWRIHYDLGLCYFKNEQPREAARSWLACEKLGREPEATAAAIRLAEVRIAEGDAKAAAALLKGAAGKLRVEGKWANALVSESRALAVFDRALATARQVRDIDLVVLLLGDYARLAPPRRVLSLRGQALAEAAEAQLRTKGAPSPEAEKEARALYRQAGDAYAEAAALTGLTPADQAGLLWPAVRHYLAAGEAKKAREGLDKLVRLERDGERLGEAWYRLGLLREQAGAAESATQAYEKCIEQNTRWDYLARHQIALAQLRAGELDSAELALVQNYNALRFDTGHEALPLSLAALSNLLYKRRDYKGVQKYLEPLLPLLKEGPDLTLARFQLADSYRQLAAQHTQDLLLTESMSAEARAHHQKHHRQWLQKAADEFAALETFLESPRSKGHLSADLRKQVPFITAKCWFNLGQFDKALKSYERLLERYPDQVEGLDALGGAVSCHAAVGDLNRVRQRLVEVEKMLPKMPPDVREAWGAWLEEALAPLKKLDKEKGKGDEVGSE